MKIEPLPVTFYAPSGRDLLGRPVASAPVDYASSEAEQAALDSLQSTLRDRNRKHPSRITGIDVLRFDAEINRQPEGFQVSHDGDGQGVLGLGHHQLLNHAHKDRAFDFILAHELGHVQERDGLTQGLLRSMIQIVASCRTLRASSQAQNAAAARFGGVDAFHAQAEAVADDLAPRLARLEKLLPQLSLVTALRLANHFSRVPKSQDALKAILLPGAPHDAVHAFAQALSDRPETRSAALSRLPPIDETVPVVRSRLPSGQTPLEVPALPSSDDTHPQAHLNLRAVRRLAAFDLCKLQKFYGLLLPAQELGRDEYAAKTATASATRAAIQDFHHNETRLHSMATAAGLTPKHYWTQFNTVHPNDGIRALRVKHILHRKIEGAQEMTTERSR